jgi:regulatory subunit for Cdc7p protein kinase
MATVSLSPSPISVSAVMSSRRGPLASNPNVANSPLRGASTLSGYPKQKRSYATVQREEAYGQPPPVKKQALENGAQRPVRSPSKLVRPATTVQRAASRLPTRGPASKTQSTTRSQEADNIEAWKKHHRLKFPQMIFYFESIPDDLRAKLTKKIAYLGAVCVLFGAFRVPGLMFFF